MYFMKNSCRYCTKTRSNLLFVFVIVLLLNAIGRVYLDLPLADIKDVMLLPSAVTLIFGFVSLLFKPTKIQSENISSKKNKLLWILFWAFDLRGNFFNFIDVTLCIKIFAFKNEVYFNFIDVCLYYVMLHYYPLYFFN